MQTSKVIFRVIADVFVFDPDFEANEAKYRTIRKEILGDDDADTDGEEATDEESDGEDEEPSAAAAGDPTIVDSTETNLVALRRTIYLTIQSSLAFEECCHKLLRITLQPGQEVRSFQMMWQALRLETGNIKRTARFWYSWCLAVWPYLCRAGTSCLVQYCEDVVRVQGGMGKALMCDISLPCEFAWHARLINGILTCKPSYLYPVYLRLSFVSSQGSFRLIVKPKSQSSVKK